MNTADKDALHAAIMNLPINDTPMLSMEERLAFMAGHRDARHAAAQLVASHPAEMMDTEVQKSEAAHVTSPVPTEINKTALPSGYSREDVAALAGSLVARMEARLSAMHESGAGSVAIGKGLAFDLHYVLKLASELGEPVKLRIDATPLDQQPADSWMAGAFVREARVEPSERSLSEPAKPDEKAPAVGVGSPVSAGSTAMEVLAELVACREVPAAPDDRRTWSERWQAAWDRAKALVSAQGATR